MKNILIALIILIGFDQASALKKILKLKIEKKIQPYLGDYYNDNWEKFNPPFSIINDDYYDSNELTVGGKYEEDNARGKVKVNEEGGLYKSLNNLDWSYDKYIGTNGYRGNQGKQWNK